MLKRGYSRMGVEFARNLAGNARLRIAMLGQAPPISTLSFVVHTREKAEVSRRFLSENLFGSKLGKERWPLEALILLRSRSFELLSRLVIPKRSPRTRSKALSGLRRFCQWAVDEDYLRRNPARLMERPNVVAMAPTELSEKQRVVLHQLVKHHATHRVAAIFALGYWAGLRISEIAALRVDQCRINQRAGSITLIDAKGGKTRTLDLHNMARRALYDYLFPRHPQDRERDEESV